MRVVYTVLWSRNSFTETTTSTGSTTTATLSYVLGQWAMKSSVMYTLDHTQKDACRPEDSYSVGQPYYSSGAVPL